MTKVTCTSCGASTMWVKTTSGKSMPLDPQPVVNGNVYIDGATGLAHVRKPDGAMGFRPHFVTCPNADQHRKQKDLFQ